MSLHEKLVNSAVHHYRKVFIIVAAVTVLLAALAAVPSLFPGAKGLLNAVRVDTDPENMLPEDAPVREFHDRMKEKMNQHDMVVVGVVNDEGMFNPLALQRVYEITQFSMNFQWRGKNEPRKLEGLVKKDMLAPSKVDKTVPEGGQISFSWLMPNPPLTDQEAQQVLAEAQRVPFIADTLIAKDGEAVAIYLPITKKIFSSDMYYRLEEQMPVLWRWAPIVQELRKAEKNGELPVAVGQRLRRIGRNAAQFASSPEAFLGDFRRVVENLGKGETTRAQWQKPAERVEAWREAARQLDQKFEAKIKEASSEAEKENIRARWARAAHEALVSHLESELTDAEDTSLLQFALYREKSRRLSSDSANERIDVLAGALRQNGETFADTSSDVRSVVSAKTDEAQRLHGAYPGKTVPHVSGLPVAEDTFGVEMFKQMAISAPTAMLIIFVLMLIFFRQLALVISSMIIAMVSVITTMSALVIAGFPIHIMSSMIPIFIMPIAVLDSIHMLSEFFERYQETKDREKTIRSVMDELFVPMLYTSLTSAAGFASLALTPIPPVQVFGIFVAIGIMVAWILTMTLIPAFVMVLSPQTLDNFGIKHEEAEQQSTSLLARLLRAVGSSTYRRAKPIILFACVILIAAAWGISLIQVNDNPVKWFTSSHPIRVATRVLNEKLGGTYMSYLTLEADKKPADRDDFLPKFQSQIDEQLGEFKQQSKEASAVLEEFKSMAAETVQDVSSQKAFFDALKQAVDEKESQLSNETESGEKDPADDKSGGGPALPGGLNSEDGRNDESADNGPSLPGGLGGQSSPQESGTRADSDTTSRKRQAWQRIADFVDDQRGSMEVFKKPENLAYLTALQNRMAEIKGEEGTQLVGKTNSFADIVKTVYRDLRAPSPQYGVAPEESEYFELPEDRGGVAACVLQYQNSHRPQDLWHFVTQDYRRAVIWTQLKSGDNKDMKKVADAVSTYIKENPPPEGIHAESRWFGLTYINVVWQHKMVIGMVSAFVGSFLVVFLLMTLLFRSALWGALCMIPLTVTIAAIYGIIGIIGKDYDMPVAVLSSLTLGLAVDFAIHFLARSRKMYQRGTDWHDTIPRVFGEPARAILRNIIVITAGFLPLLLAPLVPYKTVGALLATILVLSGIATLVLLPAVMRLLEKPLFTPGRKEGIACNCVTCAASAAAVAGLVIINVRRYLEMGWNGLVLIAILGIVGALVTCCLRARSKKCGAAFSEE